MTRRCVTFLPLVFAVFAPLSRAQIDLGPVTVGALLPIAELCQALDGCLVPLQFEPSGQHLDRVVARTAARSRGCFRGPLADGRRAERNHKAANRNA